jgi:hypothetical protein
MRLGFADSIYKTSAVTALTTTEIEKTQINWKFLAFSLFLSGAVTLTAIKIKGRNKSSERDDYIRTN